MIKYYFKTAFRSLRSQRVSSLVNVIGLTMGITSVITIMLFVLHEKSYEKFYKNAEHIFRVSPVNNARTAPILSPLLKKDIPDILASVRLFHFDGIVKANDYYYNEDRCFFADPGFLNIFSYDLTEGDRNQALQEPGSMVISQSTARKYFGAQNTLGKILYIQDTIPVKVTGVYKDLPVATHLKTDMVISFATRKIMGARLDTWDNNIYYTYVLLHKNITQNSFQFKLNDFVKKNINGLPNREAYKLEAQNICDIHLNSARAMEIEPNSRKTTLQIFISIALFVLLIACINYINISTATASRRRKEIGLRKTIGARGIQIKIQYLSESVLTALISFIIAVALTILLLPVMNSVTGTDLKVSGLFEGGLVFFIIGFVILVGLLAGIYPAAMLSSFSPVINLAQRNSAGKQKIYFRQVFVAVQFALSLILVIGTIIIYRQLNFVKKQSLGFDQEHVLILPFNYDAKVTGQHETLKQALLKNPCIRYVTEPGDIPGKVATTMSFWAADSVNFLNREVDIEGKRELRAGTGSKPGVRFHTNVVHLRTHVKSQATLNVSFQRGLSLA